MKERQEMDKPPADLVEIIRLTENVAARICGLQDEAEIYRIVREEFAKSKRYDVSIALVTDDESKIKIVEMTLPPDQLRAWEWVTGARLRGFEIDLNQSSIYYQVVKEGKTILVNVGDIVGELFPRPLARFITKVMGYRKENIILTPLRSYGKVIGAFGLTSTELAEDLIPPVRNLAHHISTALQLADEHSKRQRAEESLRILASIVESSDDAIIYRTLDGIIIKWSPGAERLYSYSAQEIEGRPVSILIPPDRHSEISQTLERLKRGEDVHFETVHLGKDGQRIPVFLKVLPVKDGTGTVIGASTIARDISEQVLAAEALRRQRDELATRSAILTATLRTTDLDELLHFIMDEVLAFLGVEFAGIHLVQANQVVLRAWRGLPAAFRAQVLAFPADDPPDWMREKRVIHEHLNETRATPAFIKNAGIQAWASVPLCLPQKDDAEGGWLGTLMVGCRSYEALSEDDVRALQAMSDQLALAIDHLRTYREAQERLARLQTLRDVDRAIIQSLDLRDVLHVVLERVPKELGADAAAISLLDEEQLRSEVFAMHLPNGTFVEEEVFGLAESLLHWFVNRQEPVIIHDLSQDPRVQMHRQRIRDDGLISYLGVPLVVREKTIGILHIMTSQPKVFADEDVAFFRTMAGQAAIAIENARLYEAVRQELARRIEAQEELANVNRYLRAILSSTKEAIFTIDMDWRIQSCNRASQEMLGYTESEMVGQTTAKYYPSEEAFLDFGRRMYPALEEKGYFTGAFELRRANGDIFPAEFTVSVLKLAEEPLGLVAVLRDITERKKAEEEQARLRRRLEALWGVARMVDASHQALGDHVLAEMVAMTQSRYGFYGFLNEDESVMTLYSWTKEAMEECRIKDKPRKLAIAEAGLWGEAVRQRKTLIINDYQADQPGKKGLPEGHVPLTRILVVPIFSHGRIVAVAAVADKATDYTEEDAEQLNAFITNAQAILERREAEEALAEERALLARRVEERTAELRRANAELARASRLKDEFLASMSHELRTPLNAILGLAEALQEEVYGPLNERQRKSLYTIEESGRHLLAMINDILDVSKIEAGRVELQIGPVSVEAVCQASLRLITQSAHEKRLQVSATLDEAVRTIQADQRRLKQILVNLLDNAVKFTPEGGAIGLEVVGDAGREVVHFTVWDTGIGIPPEEMGRLFQPFVQLDSRLSRQYSGTGLGLTLVHHLADLHGGGVAVESELGKGSRFTVSLPWRLTATGAEEAIPPEPGEGTVPPPSRPHGPLLLLAEDSEESIAILSDYLRMMGYRTITARNGVEALRLAKVKKPDLILMDIQMPRMDGLEAIRRLRADAELVVVPIIALTALAMPGDRERCLEAGANDYLSKPVYLKELAQAIEVCLSQRQD